MRSLPLHPPKSNYMYRLLADEPWPSERPDQPETPWAEHSRLLRMPGHPSHPNHPNLFHTNLIHCEGRGEPYMRGLPGFKAFNFTTSPPLKPQIPLLLHHNHERTSHDTYLEITNYNDTRSEPISGCLHG